MSEIKMIWDRLLPEVKEVLVRDKATYPHSIPPLIKLLKNTYTFSHLRIRDVHNLISFSDIQVTDVEWMDVAWGDKFLIKE